MIGRNLTLNHVHALFFWLLKQTGIQVKLSFDQ